MDLMLRDQQHPAWIQRRSEDTIQDSDGAVRHPVHHRDVGVGLAVMEADDARRRLYSPPLTLRLELHHPDDQDDDHDAGGLATAAAPAGRPPPRPTSDEAAAAATAAARVVERGCLASCFPGCHAPVYRAGHVITGHLLVRPITRLLISGQPLPLSIDTNCM